MNAYSFNNPALIKGMVMRFTISCILILYSGQVYSVTKPLDQSAGKNILDYPFYYIGFGNSIKNSFAKKQVSLIGSGVVSLGFFMPLVKREKLSFGFNLDGEYYFTGYDQMTSFQSFHVVNETSTKVKYESTMVPPRFLRGQSGSTQLGYKFEFGPQINIICGKHIIISPIFQIGYTWLLQKEFNIVQTSSVNGWVYQYNLLNQAKTKTDGMVLTPKLRIQYLTTKRGGLWVEVNYAMGPMIKTSVREFSPQGSPDGDGKYTLSQMQSGTIQSSGREARYNIAAINIGVFANIMDKKNK